MPEAVVMNPETEGGNTGFPIVAGDYLAVKKTGSGLTPWRMDTGGPWASVEADVGWLVQSADNRSIYYELDGALRRMPLDPEELVEQAHQRSRRDFSREECVCFLPDGTDCSTYADTE